MSLEGWLDEIGESLSVVRCEPGGLACSNL
jgi:hypothetical protein